MPMDPSRAGSVTDRFRGAVLGLAVKFAKFGVVGAIALVVDVGLFNLLSYVGAAPLLAGQPLLAKVVSTAAATLVAWVGNRLWTFRQTKRTDVLREFVLYAVMCTIGLGISLLCLWVSHYLFGFTSAVADNIAANVVGLAAGTLFRFWAYQRFVFVNDTVAEQRTLADQGEPTAVPSQQSDQLAANPGPSLHLG